MNWKMAIGEEDVRARIVAEIYEGPDLQGSSVDTSGCASLRSSHLRVISLRALRKWNFWSLGIKNAYLQADGFGRGVFLRDPAE